MTSAELDQVADALLAFHAEFAPFFGRSEARLRSEQFLRGLLVQQTDRRNAENLAEAIPGATSRAFQRFLSEAPWAAAAVRAHLQAWVRPRLSHPDGVWLLDETGAAKQGRYSVGVARQYCGTLGKVGNCQVGVFLAYSSPLGHALLDAVLYLPAAWTDDPDRCRRAGVPGAVDFQTKGAVALRLIRRARALGQLTGQGVAADCAYGSDPRLRDGLNEDGLFYIMDVRSTQRVFSACPATAVPPWSGRGPQPTKVRCLPDSPVPQTVADVVASWPAEAWQLVSVGDGVQGPREYRCAARQVWDCREGLPGPVVWLVARRNSDGRDQQYAFSNAPADTPLVILAQRGGARWGSETEFETMKGEAGLVDYAVRSWRGWEHHITMALLAGAFLLQMQQEWGKKDACGDAPTSEPGVAGGVAAAGVDAGGVDRLVGGDAGAQHAGGDGAAETAGGGGARAGARQFIEPALRTGARGQGQNMSNRCFHATIYPSL